MEKTKKIVREYVDHICDTSADESELLFRLSGVYGKVLGIIGKKTCEDCGHENIATRELCPCGSILPATNYHHEISLKLY